MPLTKDELLKPRYKVVIDYPGCPWDVGRILTPIGNGNFDCKEAPTLNGVIHPELYKDVFQPLPWWSDRKPEDMPEYLEWPDTGVVCKPSKYIGQYFYLSDDDSFGYNLAHVNIATEEEYTAYINQKQQCP